jgi:short-subunit dehydrogenase
MRHFVKDGASFFLAARSQEKLNAVAEDLTTRGAGKTETFVFDVNLFDNHDALFEAAEQSMGGVDVFIVSHGTLPNQRNCETSVQETISEFETNALATISLLTLAANRLEHAGAGTIVVISSVAGDRGRKSNYVYGSAKAAVSTFTAGLRNRLYLAGVNVITVKPGFVDTPMTQDFSKSFLWAKPVDVGYDIYRSVVKGRSVVYTPWFWRPIMLVIKMIPETLFKRMSL